MKIIVISGVLFAFASQPSIAFNIWKLVYYIITLILHIRFKELVFGPVASQIESQIRAFEQATRGEKTVKVSPVSWEQSLESFHTL